MSAEPISGELDLALAELEAERSSRQRMAAEALRSLESERAAWAYAERLQAALVVAICRVCLDRPAAEDCWSRVSSGHAERAACNAARRALAPEFLAVLAAAEREARAKRRAADRRGADASCRRNSRPEPCERCGGSSYSRNHEGVAYCDSCGGWR
jgi:hypothetical protein